MKRFGLKSAVIATVILVDAALALFPDWVAVHPRDPSLTMPLGLSWIASPPPPPEHFETMHVRKGTFWMWGIALITGVGVVACVIDLIKDPK